MDKLTGLQLFIRLVESGSFSRTARDMKLSQPTVTKHIAALEARLGVRLLNRNTRGMRLTEAGALYYDRCKIIDPQDPEMSAQRLALVDAARIVFANGLCLLGISAPEKM